MPISGGALLCGTDWCLVEHQGHHAGYVDCTGRAGQGDGKGTFDEQFFFRVLALNIQNAGDTYGRFTALNKYDFKKLYAWFKLLDEMDNTSNMLPSLATYYYSQTQHVPDVRYMVDYLYEHSSWRPEVKWWWLVQATYLANHKLKDKELALKVAQPLVNARTIPIWAQQMPAFIHEQRGEMDEALAIMENIQKDLKDIPQGELNFMKYFVEERLQKLEDIEKKQKEEGQEKKEPADE